MPITEVDIQRPAPVIMAYWRELLVIEEQAEICEVEYLEAA